MWKKSVYAALIFGSVFLVGCNNNDEAANDNNTLERDMNNVEQGIDEGVNDAQRAVEDVVDPDSNVNHNGNGADYDVDDNAVDGINGNTGVNGTDTRIIEDNKEDIIEDRVDRNDRDNIDE